ncbi:MAG: hypothetical protein E7000_05870 [Coriobacteriaceae bacterium]|nr:hypothetical protein [Coriobacteriaceae bacterium]
MRGLASNTSGKPAADTRKAPNPHDCVHWGHTCGDRGHTCGDRGHTCGDRGHTCGDRSMSPGVRGHTCGPGTPRHQLPAKKPPHPVWDAAVPFAVSG